MNTIGTKYVLGEQFMFDPNSNSLQDMKGKEEAIRLGSNESRILQLLVENPNKVIKRSELHDFVWRQQGFEVDDSSLTQAISTLRKMLNDSTKSPEFVKTVPKRGYQLIAPVEVARPEKKPAQSEINKFENEELITPTEVTEPQGTALPHDAQTSEGVDISTPVEINEEERQAIKQSFSHSNADSGIRTLTWRQWSMRLAWILAVALPVFAFNIHTVQPASFRTIGDFSGIPVETTTTNPSLQPWLSTLDLCIKKHLSDPTQPKPVKILVTGNDEHKIDMSIYFTPEFQSHNVTMHIISEPSNLMRECQS